MKTAADLRREADDLEARGHAAGDVPAMRALWAQADRLRAEADRVEAATIGWRGEVADRVAAAADVVLGRGVGA